MTPSKLKLAALCVGVGLLAAACGGGGSGSGKNGTGDTTTGANGSPRATTRAPQLDATPPAGVKAAPEGKVNMPKAGTYTYTLTSNVKNAATPNEPARTSPPDAEWTSKVTVEGRIVTAQDRTSEGTAVSTVRRRWDDDAVRELGFGTKTKQGTASCEFSEPAVVLPIPVVKGKLPKQTFKGTGNNCTGTRTITIVRREDVTDAEGRYWPSWRIDVETIVKSTGLTNRSKESRWFSPDLGKDVRSKSVAEYINPSGGIAARADSEIALRTYPKA